MELIGLMCDKASLSVGECDKVALSSVSSLRMYSRINFSNTLRDSWL